MELEISVASRIRGKRSEFDMSQEDLANMLGVNVTTVCSWESGKTTPSAPLIVMLSEIFKVTPNYLLGWNK